MKKRDVIELIKDHFEQDNNSFKDQTLKIAREFDLEGDPELSEYILGLLNENNNYIPQDQKIDDEFQLIKTNNLASLQLPSPITDDIKGIINAVRANVGVHKFLFVGSPGTGKTESAKQIARLLDRKLLLINFDNLIDSKLGQTAKNLKKTFTKINQLASPTKYIIFMDEIDAITLDRINNNDLREMGRVTSTFLKELDNLNEEVILIATTNLYQNMDKAITRRFDAIINFDRYSKEDLLEISELLLNYYLKQAKHTTRDLKIFKKIMKIQPELPNPADLKNLIRTSVAFSDPSDEFDYLKRIMKYFYHGKLPNIKKLSSMGFTIREIAILTGISKSSVARELNNE